jgi:hypothetical protein
VEKKKAPGRNNQGMCVYTNPEEKIVLGSGGIEGFSPRPDNYFMGKCTANFKITGLTLLNAEQLLNQKVKAILLQ